MARGVSHDSKTAPIALQSCSQGSSGKSLPSWRLISASPLRNSISVVGSFHITFVNADPDRTWNSHIALRFRGSDGALHIPETPLSRLDIAADSTVVIRDNFILEVADAQTANNIAQMNIVLF